MAATARQQMLRARLRPEPLWISIGNPADTNYDSEWSAYSQLLHYISVFGPVSFTGGAPNADCSNATDHGRGMGSVPHAIATRPA